MRITKMTDLGYGQCYDFKANDETKCQEIIDDIGYEKKMLRL